MIKRLKTKEEIAKLLGLQDNAEEYFPCSRGEWIQWLGERADSPKVAIWARFKDDECISSYVVAFDMVNLPLSRHVFIVYLSSLLEFKEFLDPIIEWSRSLGATSVRGITDIEGVFDKHGFKAISTMMELEV